MNDGIHCDNCNHHLQEDDFDRHDSWSYTCPDCGFRYRHGESVDVQVKKFNESDDDLYDDEEEETG